MASLAMTQVWQLILLWGIVVGVGTGLTAMVLAATVATRWFVHRRGLVMGMLAASSATGQLVFLPLIAELTTLYGWRMALVFVCGLLALPPWSRCCSCATGRAILICRSMARPPSRRRPPRARACCRSSLRRSTMLRQAAGVPLFWVLFATFFICGSSTNGLIQTHFITLCADYGLAAVDRGERARHDGRVRFHRHHRLGLAVRPLRQSLAAVLVLRPARAVAALSAVHRPSRSTACRCSRCSTGSTGSPPCRRP